MSIFDKSCTKHAVLVQTFSGRDSIIIDWKIKSVYYNADSNIYTRIKKTFQLFCNNARFVTRSSKARRRIHIYISNSRTPAVMQIWYWSAIEFLFAVFTASLWTRFNKPGCVWTGQGNQTCQTGLCIEPVKMHKRFFNGQG